MKKIFEIVIIPLFIIILLTSCNVKKHVTFKELTEFTESEITEIEFRNGATGALYRTNDSEKIKAFFALMDKNTYSKAKQPKPFTGYLYAGRVTNPGKEVGIGFAMDMVSVNQVYYNIYTENKKEFYDNLIKAVESFGQVPKIDGNNLN